MQAENKPMLGVFRFSRFCSHLKVPRKPQQLKILGDAIRLHRVKAGLTRNSWPKKPTFIRFTLARLNVVSSGSAFMRFYGSPRLSVSKRAT